MKDSQVYEDAVKIQKFVKAWTPPKEKAIVKLPAGAFNHSPTSSTNKIKAIKLRAVDKPKSIEFEYLVCAQNINTFL